MKLFTFDVAEAADLEVGHGLREVIGGEREERQQRRAHDLGAVLRHRARVDRLKHVTLRLLAVTSHFYAER